jgi:hypothetical protein
MVTRARALRNPASRFTLAAIAIVAIEIAIVHSQRFLANVDVASWAVTFDLAITIPALYYVFVIRSGRARALSIAPVFVVCAIVAAMIVPRDHQQFLHQLRFAIAPLDLISIYLVVRALRSGSRPDGVVASFVMTELAILRYAVAGWREQRRVPDGAIPITVHERSEWGSIAACLVVLIAFESIGVHLLVSIWSTKIAWIITCLDVYGALWMIGDYHALRLRPTLITRDAIEIRHGLRWSARIARDNVVSIDRIAGESDWKRRTTLKLALMDDPRLLIRLRAPVIAHGIAGIKRTIDAIAILPDDEASFMAALAS